MICSIDFCCLFLWTVVEPQHDIAVIVEFRASHRHRLVGVSREDSQGTSGIKRQSSNSVGVEVVLIQDSLN